MKIYVISGKAKSGKSTFGKYLYDELKNRGLKPCIMHITDPLYGYARNYFNWDGSEENKPRDFLQKTGIELIKEKLGKKDFLINRLFEDIEILSNFFDAFIITDARMLYEIEAIKEKYEDVSTIKLERKNYDTKLTEEEANHVTEKEVDLYKDYDYIIENRSIEDLKTAAIEVVRNEENYGG